MNSSQDRKEKVFRNWAKYAAMGLVYCVPPLWLVHQDCCKGFINIEGTWKTSLNSSQSIQTFQPLTEIKLTKNSQPNKNKTWNTVLNFVFKSLEILQSRSHLPNIVSQHISPHIWATSWCRLPNYRLQNVWLIKRWQISILMENWFHVFDMMPFFGI